MPTDAARQYDASSRALRICCVAASKKKSCVAFGGSGSFHACSAVHGLHTAWGGVALVSAVRHAGSLWSAQPRCSLPICHVLKMIEAFAPPGTVLIGALPAVSPKENNCCALPRVISSPVRGLPAWDHRRAWRPRYLRVSALLSDIRGIWTRANHALDGHCGKFSAKSVSCRQRGDATGRASHVSGCNRVGGQGGRDSQ